MIRPDRLVAIAFGVCRDRSPFCGRDRGVSPVVGAAILVGITVVLATVVGIFVLNLSTTESERPPAANLEFSQEERNLTAVVCTGFSGDCRSDQLIVIEATHVAGDAINVQHVQPAVTSSDPELDIVTNRTVYDIVDQGPCCVDDWTTVPEAGRRGELTTPDRIGMSFYGVPEEHIEGNHLTDYDPTHEGLGDEYEIGVGESYMGDFPQAQEFRPGDTVYIAWSPDGRDRSYELTSYEVR
jgi:flagellin-like protein